MSALSNLYSNIGDFRLCPAAVKPSATGYGNTLQYWGYHQANKAEGYFRPGDYGSYGIDHWINSLPPSFSQGWRNQPDWQWGHTGAVQEPTLVPVFEDCAGYEVTRSTCDPAATAANPHLPKTGTKPIPDNGNGIWHDLS